MKDGDYDMMVAKRFIQIQQLRKGHVFGNKIFSKSVHDEIIIISQVLNFSKDSLKHFHKV